MTDEERQKLVSKLREDALDWTVPGQRVHLLCDEIERLAKVIEGLSGALAQSNAEPVRTAPETCPHCFNENDCGSVDVCQALQSNAVPVAWRYAYPDYPAQWNLTTERLVAEERHGNANCIIEPLYTAPPRPDASGQAARNYAMMLARLVRHVEKGLPTDKILKQARDLLSRGNEMSPLRNASPDASGLIDDFRKKAREYRADYKKTRDPVDGAAADVYDECADALAASLAPPSPD